MNWTIRKTAFATVALSLLVLACDEDADPAKVTDLAVVSTARGEATLQWTEVGSGQDAPANYLLAKGIPPVDWDSMPMPLVEVKGSRIGDSISYTLGELAIGRSYEVAVRSFRLNRDGTFVLGPLSNIVAFTTIADAPAIVESIRVLATTENSISIGWTQVEDGTSRPASYLVGIGTPTITWSTAVSNAVAVSGSAVGAEVSYTFSGLAPSTTYQIQVASVRDAGTSSVVFGAPSSPLTASTTAPPAITPFFTDNFDNGTRNNANGVAWKPSSARVTVSSARSFLGTHSLQFAFGPDTTNGDSSAEQRFDLGRNLSAIWIEYYLYIPANFVHRSDNPNNNKLLMIWNTTYGSGSGTWQAGYEYLRISDTSSGVRPMSSKESGDFATFVTSSGLGHPDYGKPLIGPSNPLKPGQWHRVRMQFQRSSASGVADGIMRMWIGNTLFAQMTNGLFRNLNNVGETVLRNGYLFGWSNSGFATATTFHVDEVKFWAADPGWMSP